MFDRPSRILLPSPRRASDMWSTRACDAHPYVGKARWYRSVRFVHCHAHACHLLECIENRLRDRASRGLDQPVTTTAKRLAREGYHRVIADRMGELVGSGRGSQIKLKYEIERKSLADLRFVRHHPMMRVQRKGADKHSIRHPALQMAAPTRSACTVSWTSWTRTMLAPFVTARRCAAIDPPSRRPGSAGATLAMKRLREEPTRRGSRKHCNSASLAIAIMLCSGFFPNPMPGSSTI